MAIASEEQFREAISLGRYIRVQDELRYNIGSSYVPPDKPQPGIVPKVREP